MPFRWSVAICGNMDSNGQEFLLRIALIEKSNVTVISNCFYKINIIQPTNTLYSIIGCNIELRQISGKNKFFIFILQM